MSFGRHQWWLKRHFEHPPMLLTFDLITPWAARYEVHMQLRYDERLLVRLHSKNNGMKFIPKEYDLHPNEFHTYGTHAGLFKCGKGLKTPFSPPWKSSEARAGLFKYSEGFNMSF